jgi:predicted O-methyltransferase YrrM
MKPPQYYRRFDYDRRLLPNFHLAQLEDGVGAIDQAIEKTGYTIGYPGWGLLYHILLSHLKPDEENIIVETGTNIGCTTIVLAQALKDSGYAGKVYTVELEPENHERALANFEAANVGDYIESHCGDSIAFLKDFADNHEHIRIAFLDASHLHETVMTEFATVHPRLGPQSVVIFDNTYLIAEEGEDQRVHGALKDIQQRYEGNLINLEFVSWYTPGIAIWQKTPFSIEEEKNDE